MPSYFVRITHAYEIAKPIIHEWALRCDKMLAYEHSQDTGTAKGQTHIHLLLTNTSVDKKQLRNIAAATKIPVKGNENMSFKAYDGDTTPITYMTKGKISPSYNKGYSDEELLLYKSRWVEPQDYVKPNPWQKLYEEYKPYAPTPQKVDWEAWARSSEAEPPKIDNFQPFELHAKKWLSKKLNGIWCPQYSNMLKCLVYTHCWQNSIDIPKGWKAQ